jgi:PII-like signaling protein
MKTTIKTKELGKLKVYMTRNDKITSEKLIGKLFPKNALNQIVQAAKNQGILTANVFHTYAGFTKNGNIHTRHQEYESGHLPVCLELIDEREKLEAFFKEHHAIFKGKVVVYKTVECWEVD